MNWRDPWVWIAAFGGIAGGIMMFIPLRRVLKWRARMLRRMDVALNRTALSVGMEAGTAGWIIAGAIVFLFLPPMLLPHATGLIYIAGFIIGTTYRRPRFNREMEEIGIAAHATRRRPDSDDPK
jgi:hypothetical protein